MPLRALANRRRTTLRFKLPPDVQGGWRLAGEATLGLKASFLAWLSQARTKIYFIGQFVHVCGCCGWEVAAQFSPDCLDAAYQAPGEISGVKSFGDEGHDFLPKLWAHFLMNAVIPSHDQLAARGDDEEQHAIALFCVCDPQSSKSFGGGRFGAAPEERGDGDTDFPRRMLLGLRYRCFDSCAIEISHPLATCCYHDPLAPPPPERPPRPKNPPLPQPPPLRDSLCRLLDRILNSSHSANDGWVISRIRNATASTP